MSTSSPAPPPALAPPPGHPRFALFASLRGLAAVAILAFHVAGLTGALDRPAVGEVLTVLGPRSVSLFFVISGFLIYRPFVAVRATERPRPSVLRYGRRRLLRIVPGYWLALTVLAVFPGVVGVFTGDWWRYYFFLQLYSYDTVGGGIPVAWTLSVVVAYYVLLPVWALGVARLRLGSGPRAWLFAELGALALIATVGIATQVAGAQQLISDLTASSLLGQSTWFALGMALAVASVAVEQNDREPWAVRLVARHPGQCWIAAGACLVGLSLMLEERGLGGIVQALTTKQPIPRILAGIALTAAMITLFMLPAIFGEREGGLPRRVLAAAPIAFVGLISYGLFIWHLTIAQLLALPADPQHFSAPGVGLVEKIDVAATPILFTLTLGVSAVLATASYYLVEQPFLARKGR